LTASLFTAPLHGAVALNANGSFVYTPDADYFGPDGFRYRANDGVAFSNVAAVVIDVISVNDPPTATDDSASTTINTAVVIDVASNDSGLPEGDLVIGSASPTTAPANGTAAGNSDGTITYTPNNGFKGIDTFDYEICDSGGCATPPQRSLTTPGGGGGGGGGGDGRQPSR
jgi:hypothetical protein